MVYMYESKSETKTDFTIISIGEVIIFFSHEYHTRGKLYSEYNSKITIKAIAPFNVLDLISDSRTNIFRAIF